MAIASVLVALASCSEAPGPPAVDAGHDAGATHEAPRIPWLTAGVPPIAIAPCSPGWREVHDGDTATCDPYPVAGPETCVGELAHFPGSPGCEPVGTACPAGEWAEGLPSASVLYVRRGAAAGGDGSRAAPFARISDAMSAASVGTVVALSRGRWDEVVRIGQDVTLQGACSAETVIASSLRSETAAVVNVSARGAQLRDVRIGEAPRRGISVGGAGADLHADGVIVSGVRDAGVVIAAGGRFTATRLVVRDTRSMEGTGAFGLGLLVGQGATAEVARAVFERNRDVGVSAIDVGTRLLLADVAVRDTQGRERDGAHGRGLVVQAGATVDVARAIFERNHDDGVYVADTGTNVRLTSVVVRDTQSQQSDRTLGRGLSLQGGASVEMRGVLLERNRDLAIFADGAGTSVRLEDAVVRDTQSRESDRTFGRGINVQGGARAELARVLFERNRDVGVLVSGGGTSVRLEDAVVRDTQSRESDQTDGRGLSVQGGAIAEVARSIFERNRMLGIFTSDADTSLRAEDVVVRDTLAPDCGDRCLVAVGGVGVGSYSASTLSMTRFIDTRAALCGMQIALGGGLDLSDGEVRESSIGACVQVSDYELSRLNSRVVYVDNGTNIVATDLPVPEAVGSVTEL